MNSDMNFRSILDMIIHRWRTIALVAVLAALLAAIFSGPYFIRPMYRSFAAIYPVNLHPYAGETPTEQLLQLMHSNNIRDTLLVKYRLDSVYEIDTNAVAGRYWLQKELDSRVSIAKTVYESVEVEVRDEDPKRARDMVTTMLNEVNELALSLHRKRAREVLVITQDAMAYERARIDSIEARLDSLRKGGGLMLYNDQPRELTRGAMQMIATGAPRQRIDEVKAMVRDMEARSGEFERLYDLNALRLESFSQLMDAYERARVDVQKVLTYIDVVVHPEVTDKKVYPVRWLIVVLSVISAVLLTIILLVIREARR